MNTFLDDGAAKCVSVCVCLCVCEREREVARKAQEREPRHVKENGKIKGRSFQKKKITRAEIGIGKDSEKKKIKKKILRKRGKV